MNSKQNKRVNEFKGEDLIDLVTLKEENNWSIEEYATSAESKIELTVVVKNGCAKASLTVIRFSGSTTKHFLMRSFGSSAMFETKMLIEKIRIAHFS